MKQCKCGSYALNLHNEGIEQGELCDRHYWQDRAEKAEKDAARYRWIRHSGNDTRGVIHLLDGCPSLEMTPEWADYFDSQIDAAIAKDAP